MKKCRSCKEEIASDATKCPKCQAFQNKFNNPQMWAMLPMLLVLPLLFFMRTPRGVKFHDYKTEILVEIINIDTVLIREQQNLNILIEIDNQSEKDWKVPTYEVQYLSTTGELLNVENGKNYQLIIPANQKVNSSIKVPVYEKYKDSNIKVRLTKLDNDWY